MVAHPTIGSSDAAAVLGLSPWQTPWSVWARLVGLTERDSGGSDATRRGNMLEAAILQRWSAETGVPIEPGPPISADPILHPREAWRSCRPDAIGAFSSGERIIIEAKSARYLDEADGWGEARTDRVPRHYAVQVVWQMATLGIERADLAAFGTVKDDWRVFSLERRPALEAGIVGRIRDWYEAYVLTNKPPPVDGTEQCAAVLPLLYQAPAEKVYREPTADDLALARDLADVRRQLATLETLKTGLENQLKDRIGEAYGLKGVATWGASSGRESIDAKALKAAHPDIAAKFTSVGKPSRTFRFTFTTEENP